MNLPEGLKYHCATCKLVIPVDAPIDAAADCAEVVRTKLSWFNPHALPAAQFAMAAGTWSLLHWAALRSASAHPDVTAYNLHVHTQRKAAYNVSAVRQGMTGEQLTAEASHPSHAWLHAVDPRKELPCP